MRCVCIDVDEKEQESLFDIEAESGGAGGRRPHVRSAQVFKKAPRSDASPDLIPENWLDWIPKDDLAWVLKPLLREFDLSGLLALYSDCGGVAYDPVSLLALVLYGTLDGVHSSRELEKRCRTDARYRFLLDGQVPDHCSIHRFRRRIGDALPELLGQTADLLGLHGKCSKKKGALDGTRIPGNVSQWRRMVRNEDGDESRSDPEARQLFRTHGDYVVGYNLQVAVDSEHLAVLGCEASNNAYDGNVLESALDACEEQGGLPEKLALDAGYADSACAEEIAGRGVEGFASPKEETGLFWKEREDGRLVCPAGHALRREGRFAGKNGRGRVRYWIKECPECPLKETCCKARFKTLTVREGSDPVHWVRNSHRARSPEGEDMRKMRGRTVEVLFAQLFWNLRFRRLLMRGLSGASIHLLILCLAHNLRLLGSLVLRWLRTLEAKNLGLFVLYEEPAAQIAVCRQLLPKAA